MGALEDAFDAVLGEHRQIGSPLEQYLRPSRSEPEIVTAIQELDLEPSAEVVAWFTRFDGIDHERHRSDRAARGKSGGRLGLYYPNAFPYSISEAIVVTQDLRNRRTALVPHVDPDARWREDWLALMMIEPDWVAVECRPGAVASIWHVSWNVDEERADRVLPGITAYLEAIARALRADRYFWNDEHGTVEPGRSTALVRPAAVGLEGSGRILSLDEDVAEFGVIIASIRFEP